MSNSLERLPSLACECGATVVSDEFMPNSRGGASTASGFDSCLRRCEACGIGFSNCWNPSDVKRILRDPFVGLAAYVAEGCDRALAECLNQSHARKKKADFQSLSSEDHATWTVMRFLQHERLLGQAFRRPGIEPVMLIWGVPVPNNSVEGCALREKIITICDDLKEQPKFRSEPDVVLDFGEAGIVIVEAKLWSPNEFREPSYGGWPKYLNDAVYRDPGCARAIGYYQLARNWRIACELAGERPFTLVNLGLEYTRDETRELARLRLSFRTSARRRFVLRRWKTLLSGIAIPTWLSAYARRRAIPLAK